MTKPLTLVGLTFSQLTVIANSTERTKAGKQKVLCRCSCGKEKLITASALVSGNTHSCGHYSAEIAKKRLTKHGQRSSLLYFRWNGMMQRCYNPKATEYKNYGARGIQVCEAWRHSPEQFIKDMGIPPFENASIDRRDNDGDYSPNNCYWATKKEQAINRRPVVFIEFNGERLTATDWGLKLFNDEQIVIKRLRRGWSIEESLTAPKFSKIAFIRKRGGVS